MAFHDIVAAFVHAGIDEIVAGLLERELLVAESALGHSTGFNSVIAAPHEGAQEIRMACEFSDVQDFPPADPAGTVMPRRRLHG